MVTSQQVNMFTFVYH